MKNGSVVFIYRTHEWQIARVLGEATGTVEVEVVGGERITFSQKRLAHISERTVPTVAALEAYEAEVLDLKRSLDLA